MSGLGKQLLTSVFHVALAAGFGAGGVAVTDSPQTEQHVLPSLSQQDAITAYQLKIATVGVAFGAMVGGLLLGEAMGRQKDRAATRVLANDAATTGKSTPEIGDLDDGGVYVGLSADNGKPLHAALADLPDYKTYEEALAAAEQLKAAHSTAHVPTPKELDKNLFENRNTGHLKGTFNTSGSNPGSVYRSSASYSSFTARVQWFDDGDQYDHGGIGRLPVRLVW
jgi:hypothetical protein